MSHVVVCDYGAGNTHSVMAALSRVGLRGEISSQPSTIESADHVILPGVGSARAAMDHLATTGAAAALGRRFRDGGPILGICLGLQLAMTSSDEDGGVVTLGLVDGTARRLVGERVPRLGWAMVDPWTETFYFAHSYQCDSPHTVATSEGHCAAVRHGSFLGVQFHPEKSGDTGSEWLATCLIPA